MHKRIIVDLNPPIPVCVEPTKGFGKLLDNNTGADEAVERYPWISSAYRTGLGCFNVYHQRVAT